MKSDKQNLMNSLKKTVSLRAITALFPDMGKLALAVNLEVEKQQPIEQTEKLVRSTDGPVEFAPTGTLSVKKGPKKEMKPTMARSKGKRLEFTLTGRLDLGVKKRLEQMIKQKMAQHTGRQSLDGMSLYFQDDDPDDLEGAQKRFLNFVTTLSSEIDTQRRLVAFFTDEKSSSDIGSEIKKLLELFTSNMPQIFSLVAVEQHSVDEETVDVWNGVIEYVTSTAANVHMKRVANERVAADAGVQYELISFCFNPQSDSGEQLLPVNFHGSQDGTDHDSNGNLTSRKKLPSSHSQLIGEKVIQIDCHSEEVSYKPVNFATSKNEHQLPQVESQNFHHMTTRSVCSHNLNLCQKDLNSHEFNPKCLGAQKMTVPLQPNEARRLVEVLKEKHRAPWVHAQVLDDAEYDADEEENQEIEVDQLDSTHRTCIHVPTSIENTTGKTDLDECLIRDRIEKEDSISEASADEEVNRATQRRKRFFRLLHAEQRYNALQGDTDYESHTELARREAMDQAGLFQATV